MIKIILVATILIVSVAVSGFGQEQREEKKEKIKAVHAKVIEGVVSGIDKNGIAIVYSKDDAQGIEYELYIPLEGNVVLKRAKRLAHIKMGDTVKVEYAENVVEEEEGKDVSKIKAQAITFLKAAPKAKPDAEALVSDEED